ncbi:hypothetical protein GQ600_4977 [Phytophthora cactorum]|nr:hypothetical protein GQ600_4977 [Phytophthora cactorum]
MQMTYYVTKVNTFRENPDLLPPKYHTPGVAHGPHTQYLSDSVESHGKQGWTSGAAVTKWRSLRRSTTCTTVALLCLNSGHLKSSCWTLSQPQKRVRRQPPPNNNIPLIQVLNGPSFLILVPALVLRLRRSTSAKGQHNDHNLRIT